MLARKNAYDQEMLRELDLEDLQAEEITGKLETYLTQYHSCFGNSSQVKYFETFEKGLLSDLERKTIEPNRIDAAWREGSTGIPAILQASSLFG